MNIFEKRPLSIILCVVLVAFSLFINLPSAAALIACLSIVFLISVLVIYGKKIIFRSFLIVISVLTIISIILSVIWSNVFYPKNHYGKEVSLYCVVKEIDHTKNYKTTMTVDVTDIDGKKCDYSFFSSSDKNTLSGVNKGDILKLSGTVTELGEVFYDDSVDYYISKGISAALTDIKRCEIVGVKKSAVSDFFYSIRADISSRLKLVTDYHTGSFLSALLIGQRDYLDGNTTLNFRRIGISHILAISGMNIAILSAVVSKILSLIGINRKIKSVIIPLLTLFYMAITGFPSSIVRAGFMLIIYHLIFLLGANADRFTSLFIAFSLIIIITPHAIYDISLLLSAFATLGIICYSDFESKFVVIKNRFLRLLFKTVLSIITTVFAISSTFLLTSVKFKEFSVISPFTTLIFSAFIELLMILGLIALVIGRFIPIGRLIIFFCDLIKELAEIFSSSKYVVACSENLFIMCLILIFTVAFILFLVLKIKHIKTVFLLILLLFSSIFIFGLINTSITENSESTTYYSASNTDVTFLRSNGESSIIISGNSKNAIRDLKSKIKITYADNLILTYTSYKNEEVTEYILNNIKVKKLYVPSPKNSYETSEAKRIAEKLSLYGTTLSFYSEEDSIFIGTYRYILLGRTVYTPDKSKNECVYIIGENSVYSLYVSSGYEEYLKPHFIRVAPAVKEIIIGNYGKETGIKFEYMLPNVERIICKDTAIIEQDASAYYKQKGASIIKIEAPIDIKH